MKKSIIIVIAIAVVILGGFILLGKSQPALEKKISDARLNAKTAGLKAFTASTMADMAQYYSDEKNKEEYAKNPTVKQNLESKLATLKQKNDGQYEYRIYDEADGEASVKAADTSANIYVCIDSRTIKVVDISADQFEKSTDCAGQSLKK